MSGELDHNVCMVVRKLLIDNSLCNELIGSWQSFYSHFPDTQDQGLCVYDTPGDLGTREHESGEWEERHGIQVKIRSLTQSLAKQKADAIALAFDRLTPFTHVSLQALSGTATIVYAIQNISRVGNVISLGVSSDSRRREFTINALVNVRMLST